MVNNVNIQVNALGNFAQLKTQVAALKASMLELQKMPLATTTSRDFTANIQNAQSHFDTMVKSTRAFNTEFVKMADSVDRFGTNLERGKLKFHDYFSVYRQNVKGIRNDMDSLAESQARVGKSLVIPDALRTGYARVITSITSDMKALGAAEEAAAIKGRVLNSVIRGMGTELINFGKNTQWTGRQLTVGLTVPLAAFGAAAGKAFQEVDKELTRMAKVYGSGLEVTSEKTIKVIRQQTIELTKELAGAYGIAAKDTAAAAADLAATGLQGQDLIKSTKEVMRLMALGEVDQQTAIKATIALQKTFRLETNETADAVNFLNAVENQTSTSMADLVAALPRASTVVKQLGGSYKDLSAMMVALRESGVPAAEGANAIKSAMASLINPSKQASEAFESFGINIKEITTKDAGNLMLMIKDLQGALADVAPQDRLRLIEQLFGKFQFAKMTALFENLGRVGSQTQQVFELAGASNQQLAQLASAELDKMANSVSGRYKRAVENFKTQILPIGEQVTKFATVIMNAFSGIIDVVNKLGPLKNILGWTLGLAALVGPVLMLSGLFMNLIGSLVKGGLYFKMFRDGVKDGGIRGALNSMSNFFQKIDTSSLAASRNIDYLKVSAISTEEAFRMLNVQVETLKINLAAAAGTPLSIQTGGGLLQKGKPPIDTAGMSLEEMSHMRPYMSADGGKIQGVERPHMFPGSRLESGFRGLSPAEQSMYPNLQTAQIGRAEKWKKDFLSEGISGQFSAVPEGSLEATLQRSYKEEDVIHGGKTGANKAEVYARGLAHLDAIHDKVLSGKIAADSLAAQQMMRIQSLPAAEKAAELQKIIGKVTFSEQQFHRTMVTHVQTNLALLQAEEYQLRNLNTAIDKIASDPSIKDKPAAFRAVLTQFRNAVFTAGSTAEQMMRTMTVDLERSLAVAKTTFAAALAGAEAQTGIQLAGVAKGGVYARTLPLVATRDARRTSSAAVIAGLANGGMVQKFAVGGYVSGPGGPTDDKIPAMLSGGEYVIRASSVNKYGRGALDALNNGYAVGGKVQRFAKGKKVKSSNLDEDTYAEMMGRASPFSRGLESESAQIWRTREYDELREYVKSQTDQSRYADYNAAHGVVRQTGGGEKLHDYSETYDSLYGLNNLSSSIHGADNLKNPKLLASAFIQTAKDSGNPQWLNILRKLRADRAVGINPEELKNFRDYVQAVLQRELTNPQGIPTNTLKASLAELEYRTIHNMPLKSYKKHISEGRVVPTKLGLAAQARFGEAKSKNDILTKFARGFMKKSVFARANGGQIPAMLSNGEYVMSPQATAAHGSSFMSGINNGTAKFANGGQVKGYRFGGPFRAFGQARQLFGLDPSSQATYGGAGASRGILREAPGLMPGALETAQLGAGIPMTVQEIKSGISNIFTGITQGVSSGLQFLQKGAKQSGANFQEGMAAASGEIKRLDYKTDGMPGTPIPNQASGISGRAGYANRYMRDQMNSVPGRLSSGINRYKDFRTDDQGKSKIGRFSMAGMMAAPLITGAGNAIAGNMQEGAGKAAVSAAAQGASMGMMFGPEGALVGAAVGGIFGAIKSEIDKQKEIAKNAALGLADAIAPSGTALSNLGIKIHDFANVVIKAGNESDKAATGVAKISADYKASTDPTTVAAIENITRLLKEGDTKEIKRLATIKYGQGIQGGAEASKVEQDLAGYLKSAGVGSYTSAKIVKDLSKEKGSLDSVLNAVAPKQLSPGYRTGRGGATQLRAPSFNSRDTTKIGETLFSQAQMADPATLGQSLADLDAVNKKIVNSKESFNAFNKSVKEADPELADLNLSMKHSGATTSNIVRVNTLMVNGMALTAEQAKTLALDIVALAAAEHKLSQEMHVVAGTQTLMDKAIAKDAAGNNAAENATKAATNAKQDQINALQDYINKQQKLIGAIDKEKSARDKAFQASQQQINNEKTLADLRDGITRAGASGDLISMAKAQSDYNAELAKQADQKEKDAADAVDDKRISVIQKRIDKTNIQINALNKEITKMQQVAETTINPIVKASTKAQKAVTGIQSKIETLLDSNSYTNETQFRKLIEGDKGIQGYMKTAGLSADDLTTSITKIWNSDGKTNAGLNKQLTDSAKAMGNFGTATEKAMTLKRAFNLMLAHPEWSASKALDKAEAESVTAAKAKALKEGRTTVIINGKTVPVAAATGGYISGPGTGTSDSIPARLSNGEYVVKADSVKRYGTSFLDGVNEGRFSPKAFKIGGLVSGGGGFPTWGTTPTPTPNPGYQPGTTSQTLSKYSKNKGGWFKNWVANPVADTLRRAVDISGRSQFNTTNQGKGYDQQLRTQAFDLANIGANFIPGKIIGQILGPAFSFSKNKLGILGNNVKNIIPRYGDILERSKLLFKQGLMGEGKYINTPFKSRVSFTPEILKKIATKIAIKRNLMDDFSGPDYFSVLFPKKKSENFGERMLQNIAAIFSPETSSPFAKKIINTSYSAGSNLLKSKNNLSMLAKNSKLKLEQLKNGILDSSLPISSLRDIGSIFKSGKGAFNKDSLVTQLIQQITGSLGGVNSFGVTGIFKEFNSSTGKSLETYIKQVFKRVANKDGVYEDVEDVTSMGTEAFLNQFLRGLSGSKAAIDQVIRPTEFNGKINSVLSSPFEKFTKLDPDDLISPSLLTTRELIKRHIESVMTGNWDLHSSNLMFSGTTPKMVDSGMSFLTRFIGDSQKQYSLQDAKTLLHPDAVGFGDNRSYLEKLLRNAEQSIGKKDFNKILNSEISRISRRTTRGTVSDALRRATLGDRNVSQELNAFSIDNFGQDFIPSITNILRSRAKGLKEYYALRQELIDGGNFTNGRANGGYISGPGTGTSDSIPARLSHGEYVVKANSVGKYGVDMMNAINDGSFGPKYATGGLVKNYAVGESVNHGNSSLSNNPVYNITVSVDTNANPDEIANKIMKTIQREQNSMSTGRRMGR